MHVDIKVGVVVGKREFDVPPDLVVDVPVDIQSARDNREECSDASPLEEEPAKVDQAANDGELPCSVDESFCYVGVVSGQQSSD